MADNKAIVAKLLDALWNKGQLSVADELVSKDFVGYWPFRAEPVKGPVGYKDLVAELWKVFPDQKMRILDQIAEGDKVVTRFEVTGTHRAEFLTASNATIPVNRKVLERIQRLRTLTVEVRAGRATRRYRAVKSDDSDDLVFQSVKSGCPMRDNNILARHIKPAGRKLGIGWVNWQVLRRSHATWLRMVGTDPRDRQSLMRHSRFTTTAEVYEQDLPESQLRAVEKLSTLVN